jgi:hypothetical protein
VDVGGYEVYSTKIDNKAESGQTVPIQKASGTPFIVKSENMGELWKYTPYNFDFERRSLRLSAALHGRTIRRNGVFYSKSEIDFLKAAYAEIGGTNENSMIVFSLPGRNTKILECYNAHSAGCMYTGDYNFRNNYGADLKGIIENNRIQIGTIQVPHHGSKDDFNEEIAFKDVVYPVSVAKANGKKHPNAAVLGVIEEKGGYPVIVTTEYNTRFDQYFLAESVLENS